MRHRAVGVVLVCGLAACNQLLGIPDVTQGRHVRGRVHGLWDGADGVALQLVADGVDTRLTVPRNGEFEFPPQFAPGASYTVTVATSPLQHTCVVDRGGNGLVADSDAASVSIACTGPAMTVAFSGPWAWTFDPTEDTQTFAASVIAQQVALTISGATLASATVNGAGATLGAPTAAIALPLGPTSVHIGVSASGGLSKTYELVFQRGMSVIEQLAYGKASNTGASDGFGSSISLSGDTLAVGAKGEASNATGINGDQSNNSLTGAGAVYVFVRKGTTWIQQAYLKASNTGMGDQFGASVSLSGDTLAVGAPMEASNATGINADAVAQANDSASKAGAVYVFVRTGTSWAQQAYLKASNTDAGDQFGYSVSLSDNALAVGAPMESSNATGVPTDPAVQANNTASKAGAVYVFRRSTVWFQQAYIKASNTGMGDTFGWSVSLSGETLAVSAPLESSNATGVPTAPEAQGNDDANHAGAVYVYVFARTMEGGIAWSQQAYLKASNAQALDQFGYSVSLSGDTLAVGAPAEGSAATGVNGDQADDSAHGSGAAYVFVRAGTTWSQQAYLKASNTGMGDTFGLSIAASGDAVAVAAISEASGTGDPADNSAVGSGAVYVFDRAGTTWTPRAYLKASNVSQGDGFGIAIALSLNTLVISAPGEAGSSIGFDGNQADNSAGGAGAIYGFR